MFKKILIANRGEIACRVIRTAKRMNVSTVAVYSDADENALHVTSADEAVRIGAALAVDSYLNIDAIIAACKQTGAEAVHPGYGFLSEDTRFSQVLNEAGIEFIGPGAEAIEAMGDKITSKQIARDAGVNVIPGFDDVIQNPDHAVELARQVGYPVMLKPTSAGGGKGMRLAYDDDECREGFVRSASEAKTHFGDDRVFVEKYIENPRHIEIQVLADKHGHVIHLGERECSLQRRHQKVIEEAPSPFLNASTRNQIAEQAVALARAVNYVSAGTVEFVVDKNQNFYFLEMNTRLQVEHPVTEYVTGIDLVEHMIRIATGETLDLVQSDVSASGWAIEARIYAEDPARNFLPSTGRLIYYQPPKESRNIRIDSGVCEGGEVSIYYDPMIAKLIVYGDTRADALSTMNSALDQYLVSGIATNLPFLQTLIRHDAVVGGLMDTSFIEREFPQGYDHEAQDSQHFRVAAAIATIANYEYELKASFLGGERNTHNWTAATDWVAIAGSKSETLRILKIAGGHRIEFSDGQIHEIKHNWAVGQRHFAFSFRKDEHFVQIKKSGCAFRIDYFGCRTLFRILTPKAADYDRHMLKKKSAVSSTHFKSPMPGLLVELNVKEGQQVKAGEPIAIVEAMKMENVLRAEVNAVVKKIFASQGDSLAADQSILEFKKK